MHFIDGMKDKRGMWSNWHHSFGLVIAFQMVSVDFGSALQNEIVLKSTNLKPPSESLVLFTKYEQLVASNEDAFKQQVLNKILPRELSSALLSPPFQGCNSDAYPPDDRSLVPKYVINLDLPAKERFSALIHSKQSQLKQLLDHVEDLMKTLVGVKVFDFINSSLPELAKTLPAPYYEEIIGIAEAGGFTVTQVTMYNIFYEVFTLCTSIITQDKSGHILHGRNLDFGLFLGWDRNNHTWMVSELLRPLVVELDWQKGNKTVYESVSYVGFIGVITAVKKNLFSFSFDERFSWNGGYIGLLEWIIFRDYKQKWVSFLAREVMEKANSFDEAVIRLSKPKLLAPVYFILGGTEPGQGVIITRFRESYNILPLGAQKEGQGSWFLVETNYDHWRAPPFYDDRRNPAIYCLQQSGQENISLPLIFNVLSTKPVRNKLTTFTSLMDAKKGYLQSWLQECPDPCWPW